VRDVNAFRPGRHGAKAKISYRSDGDLEFLAASHEAALFLLPFPNYHCDHNHRERDNHPILERRAEKRDSLYQPLPHPESRTSLQLRIFGSSQTRRAKAFTEGEGF
jgi:phosphatidylserine/phosphatidylglycerophosphate/cardiolipin synthase-like enzyme